MTTANGSNFGSGRRRGRKPYPTLSFEKTLELPAAIKNHGVSGSIRRLTLFGQMGRAASSRQTRALVANSARYGLTTGNFNAEHLAVTNEGGKLVELDISNDATALSMSFELAIAGTPAFLEVYEGLKEKRLPSSQVVKDLLQSAGIDASDCEQATRIFEANVRYLGLIRDQTGREYLYSLEHVLEDLGASTDRLPDEPSSADPSSAPEAGPGETTIAPETPVVSVPQTGGPALHIDIQIHIGSDATPEQIDKIFSSMARHLYKTAD